MDIEELTTEQLKKEYDIILRELHNKGIYKELYYLEKQN